MPFVFPFAFGYAPGFGWFFQILWWVIIIWLVVGFIRLITGGRWHGRDWRYGGPNGYDKPRETPVDILKERYAKGEITKKEFDDMRRDIEAPVPPKAESGKGDKKP